MTCNRDYKKIYSRAFRAMEDLRKLSRKDQLDSDTRDEIIKAEVTLMKAYDKIEAEWEERWITCNSDIGSDE